MRNPTSKYPFNYHLTSKIFFFHPFLSKLGRKNRDTFDSSLFRYERIAEDENIDGLDPVPIHVAQSQAARSVLAGLCIVIQFAPGLS